MSVNVIHILSIFILASALPLCGNEALDQADKAYKKAEKDLGVQFERFVTTLKENDPKVTWRQLHKDWMAICYRQAAAQADLTSGRGSAYSFDYLANLIEMFEQRRDFYDKLTGRLH